MSNKLSFKGTAFSLIFCAVIVAFLNLYMNIVTTYGTYNMQIDLSADGDVMAFHQFDFPGKDHSDHSQSKNLSKKSCAGLCPPPASLLTQEEYVKALIRERLKLLSSNTFAVQTPNKDSGRYHRRSSSMEPNFDYARFWAEIDSFIGQREIWPSNGDVALLLRSVSNAKIIKSSSSPSGTQIKNELLLEGGKKVLWKPRRFFRRTDSSLSSPMDRPDNHRGEIAAFHLSILLNLRRTPPAVGRKIDLINELKTVADEKLKATFFQKSNHLKKSRDDDCFYGECFYCRREDPVCADENGFVDGAIVFWLNSSLSPLKTSLSTTNAASLSTLRSAKNPWARTYDQARLASWQIRQDFCLTVLDDELFGKNPIFGGLIDAAVFDYLIGNVDRRHIDFIERDAEPLMVLLMDNGKSFGDPTVDDASILAPLYQCCRIRGKLYRTLVRLSELNLGDLLNDNLKDDPIYPILTAEDLVAVNRRLRKVIAVVASCLDQHHINKVLIEDG